MKKEFFDEISSERAEGAHRNVKLTYYLLTDSVREEFCDLNVYGVEIDKEVAGADGKSVSEKKLLRNLFFKKDEAMDFLRRIAENRVTPRGLKGVISDYIGEQLKYVGKEC